MQTNFNKRKMAILLTGFQKYHSPVLVYLARRMLEMKNLAE